MNDAFVLGSSVKVKQKLKVGEQVTLNQCVCLVVVVGLDNNPNER